MECRDGIRSDTHATGPRIREPPIGRVTAPEPSEAMGVRNSEEQDGTMGMGLHEPSETPRTIVVEHVVGSVFFLFFWHFNLFHV